jgi:hypothetical protein
VLASEDELPAIIENFDSAKNNKHKVTHVITDHFVENAAKVMNDVDIFYLTDSLSDDERRAITDLVIKAEKEVLLPSTFDNLLMLYPSMM